MKIFAICGSVRPNSANQALLMAAKKQLCGHNWSSLDLNTLPYFDPELQYSKHLPPPVNQLRTLATAADLILITTPEYAHGVPGILKNALEWLFCEGTMKKSVAVIIGSAQGQWAKNHLLDILPTMDFVFNGEQCLIISGARSKIQNDGNFTDRTASVEFEKFISRMSKNMPA